MTLIKSNVERLKQTLKATVTLEDYLKTHVVGKVPEKRIRLEALDPNNVQTAIVCPFHEDTKPSMTIFHRKQDWYCFGSCRKGGDLINLHMHASATLLGKELRYIEALESLANLYKIPCESLYYKDSKGITNGITMNDILKLHREPERVTIPKKIHSGLLLQGIESRLREIKRNSLTEWAKNVVELDYLMSLGLQEEELSANLEKIKAIM